MPAKDGLIIFRKRFGFTNVQDNRRCSSANQEAADELPDAIKKITEKGYPPKQGFNADKNALFWRKMPQETFIIFSSVQQDLKQEGID